MIDLPDRYKLIAEIIGGGMSHTLHCHDNNLKRDVVIKALRAGIAPHRLLDELAALSAIRSRYVVEIYDVVRDNNGNVIAVIEEYLAGAPLSACSAEYTITDVLKVLYPIAAGIADIHAHGRVHRDIKPDNMKFDGEGQLNIFDFGLAKLAESPGTTALYYSLGYTAPEAFQPNASGLHTFTPAIDVYAFGCVALWMLNNGSLPASLMTLPPTLPIANFSFSALAPAVPTAITEFLNRSLDKDPMVRPSMEDIKWAIAAELLRGKHRLLLTFDGKDRVVDQSNPDVKLTASGASISINYDGLFFSISAITGQVLINNAPLIVGTRLIGSSVFVMGTKNTLIGQYATSVTADVSHPEVTL
jgi:eukaryotic-like serine/threonine-protein kinase